MTVTMDWSLVNDDGGLVVDVPAFTMGGGDREMPVNESIRINVTGEAFGDPTFDTSIGVTFFPFLPSTLTAG